MTKAQAADEWNPRETAEDSETRFYTIKRNGIES